MHAFIRARRSSCAGGEPGNSRGTSFPLRRSSSTTPGARAITTATRQGNNCISPRYMQPPYPPPSQIERSKKNSTRATTPFPSFNEGRKMRKKERTEKTDAGKERKCLFSSFINGASHAITPPNREMEKTPLRQSPLPDFRSVHLFFLFSSLVPIRSFLFISLAPISYAL